MSDDFDGDGPLRPVTEALSDAVDRAIRDTVSEHGGIPQAALTIVAFLDEDGDPSWAFVVPPEQRSMTSLGLARSAELLVEEQSKREWQW